jgi:chromatin segregation and condensation protein Rec8/ScpA/Scc1 (kleisin family)
MIHKSGGIKMKVVDWQGVADAIRERRFEDVTQEIWNQIVNMIEPKKNGRPSKKPKQPKWNKDSMRENELNAFKYMHEMNEYKKTANVTAIDVCFEYGLYKIEELYEEYNKSMNTNEAYEKVAEKIFVDTNFKVGPKSIEPLMAALNVNRKIQNEE